MKRNFKLTSLVVALVAALVALTPTSASASIVPPGYSRTLSTNNVFSEPAGQALVSYTRMADKTYEQPGGIIVTVERIKFVTAKSTGTAQSVGFRLESVQQLSDDSGKVYGVTGKFKQRLTIFTGSDNLVAGQKLSGLVGDQVTGAVVVQPSNDLTVIGLGTAGMFDDGSRPPFRAFQSSPGTVVVEFVTAVFAVNEANDRQEQFALAA